VAATEALMVRAGSLPLITQTDQESKLISDITNQIQRVLSLMQAGKYDDTSIVLDFLPAIAIYSAFCFNLAYAE
jgi:hypothetical protein